MLGIARTKELAIVFDNAGRFVTACPSAFSRS